jgi:hypothetical protein
MSIRSDRNLVLGVKVVSHGNRSTDEHNPSSSTTPTALLSFFAGGVATRDD